MEKIQNFIKVAKLILESAGNLNLEDAIAWAEVKENADDLAKETGENNETL